MKRAVPSTTSMVHVSSPGGIVDTHPEASSILLSNCRKSTTFLLSADAGSAPGCMGFITRSESANAAGGTGVSKSTKQMLPAKQSLLAFVKFMEFVVRDPDGPDKVSAIGLESF